MPAWDLVVPLGGTAVVTSYVDVQKKELEKNMANVTKCTPHKVCTSSSKLQSDDTTPLYPHINTKKVWKPTAGLVYV